MRKDAKWSDGTPVTAQDFVYSWQCSVDPRSLLRMPVICNMGISPVLMKFLKGKNRLPIPGVKAIDDHTLEVTLAICLQLL
ncbi:ABC transporter substrate-binding protein [Shigella flexneri]